MVCKFSIKDLEKLSGIKAHTLRIWEQRYGLLKPERTDTNIRWYCNDELKNLLNISLLNKNGFKISKIAQLDKNEIADEVNKISNCEYDEPQLISNLIISMVEMNEQRFEKIISTSILRCGFSHTIEKLVYPFLYRIGIMWQTGSINPAQEHFISNLIRQKLIVAIDGQVAQHGSKTKKCIVYLPEGELHEISILYYTYLLKSRGIQVVYLGQSVPLIDLQKVYEIHHPDYIVSVFTILMDAPEKYITDLSKLFPASQLLFSGFQITNKKAKLPANISIFKNPEEFLSLVS